jgi:outer membrane protein assembly factor BamB
MMKRKHIMIIISLTAITHRLLLAQLASTPWPMFGHDERHTGRSSYTGPENPKVKWIFDVSAGESSPAIGPAGTIYVGSIDHRLFAINPDGSLKWTYETDEWVDSSPAIGIDGTIFVGSSDSSLYAIYPDSTLRWSYRTGTIIENCPAIGSDGTVYVGADQLYAFETDGTFKWSYPAAWGTPAIGYDGTVYAVSNGLKAIDPDDGTLKWFFESSNTQSFQVPTVGPDSTIYVGSYNDSLYAIHPDGKKKWAFYLGGHAGKSPAIGADSTIYVGSTDHKLYAIRPDGTLKWFFETGDRILSSAAIGFDGTVYIGSTDRKLYAIDKYGTLKWFFQTDATIFSTPVIGANRTLYFVSFGSLYALENTDTGVSGHTANAPKAYSLSQNWPNPFNPETAIRFSLSENSVVSLIIYDLRGRKVATIVDEYRPAGRYHETWHADGMASGIYILYLKAGDHIETRKMILQR